MKRQALRRQLWRFVPLILLAFGLSACFDLEAEVKVLDDGSGFVSVWVRMPTRIATIGAAAGGSTLAAEEAALLSRLDLIFAEREGVRLVERRIDTVADYQVLRYRYSFDSPADLNRLWQDAASGAQDVTLFGGTLTLATQGEGCGATFDASVVFAPSPPERFADLGRELLAGAAADAREEMVAEYYKGRFTFRLVLPGRVSGTDADSFDAAGNPVWRLPMLRFYQQGLTAKAATRVVCENGELRAPASDERPPEPSEPLSAGPALPVVDVIGAFSALGHLAAVDIEATVGRRSSMRVVYRFDSRVAEPMKSALLLVLATLPTLAADWNVSVAEDADGATLVTLATKKPQRLDRTGSAFLFAGHDGDHATFRLKLPAIGADPTRVPETPGPVLVRVAVTMPGDITQGNATLIDGRVARWILTARDLSVPVTIEAIADK